MNNLQRECKAHNSFEKQEKEQKSFTTFIDVKIKFLIKQYFGILIRRNTLKKYRYDDVEPNIIKTKFFLLYNTFLHYSNPKHTSKHKSIAEPSSKQMCQQLLTSLWQDQICSSSLSARTDFVTTENESIQDNLPMCDAEDIFLYFPFLSLGDNLLWVSRGTFRVSVENFGWSFFIDGLDIVEILQSFAVCFCANAFSHFQYQNSQRKTVQLNQSTFFFIV